ncbi:helix-turn-helix transcriptional regulator [Chitinophaga sp. GCM10012297]|uniref:Helix-turn-helix transcriptional regulator n=1 Tax=Chitinophaga chungangae TaxID=2821488 RepID=A0ABS3YEF9_9BACT|nr:helix-turn-helix transcriptional regulator [Chitinophaga chungangae]MBO9153072.1 helix-turn-helix transcriptional regulator [Chitinophaga chungangae]
MKNTIGKKFFYIRMLHGFTQEYVARKAGISTTSYIDLEAGRVKNLAVKRIENILALYGLTVEHFFSFGPDDLLKLIKGEISISGEKHLREMTIRIEAMYQLLFHLVDKLSASRVGNRVGKT